MPTTVPYTQFSSAATGGSDFWACSSDCTLTAHVTDATLGVTDFIFANVVTIQGSVQATEFAGKQVSYVWGFDTCSSPNGWGTQVISQVSGVEPRGFQDITQNCPTLSSIVHIGTTTVKSDGTITLTLSPQRDIGNVRDSAYYGNFVLQLTGNTADATSSAPGGGSASSSASSSDSTTAIISGTNSLSGSSTLTGSQLSSIPSLVPSWTPGQTAPLPGGSPGVGGTSPGGESEPSSSNKGPIIGGVAAAVVAVIVVLAALWLYLRKRRARQEVEIPEEHRIVPLSHDESGWGGGPGPGAGKWMELRPSKYDALRAAEKNPNLLGAANAVPGEPLPVSSNGVQSTSNAESSRRPPSVMFSTTGLPTYDSHENANQDPFFLTSIGDQRGPYTLDDTFQVHDLLGEWAEEHRDAIPYHLERRLRIGGYSPGTHPNEIAQELWLSRFAVTRFELAGLVELFERTNGMPTRRIALSAGSIADH